MRGRRVRLDCLTARGVKGAKVLDCVRLEASPGDLVLVTGYSGSGKTSLLRALGGLAGLHGLKLEGSMRVEGPTFYVPQEPWHSIVSPYPVVELYVQGFSIEAFREALRSLGVEEAMYKPSVELSAGEAQRISVALAALSGAQTLLVDEATSYVDEHMRGSIVRLLAEAAEGGATVFVVDHNPLLWRGAATLTIYMEGGRAEIYDDPLETPAAEAYGRAEKALLRLRVDEAPDGETILEARDIYHRYPDSDRYTLREASLKVRRGEVVAVTGPSGAGKSTLLRILAGLERPLKGSITIKARPHYIPENPILYISSPLVGDELLWRRDVAAQAGLEHLLHRPVSVLSSGERRRLALASAYSRGVRVILLDEPSIGLDPISEVRVARLIASLASMGCAIVFSTNSRRLASIASRSLELGGG